MAEDASTIFADRWLCAWAVVGEAVRIKPSFDLGSVSRLVHDNAELRAEVERVGVELAKARDYGRKMHRRAQEAEGALADLDWALDHFKIRPRGEWKGYGELDLARRIQDGESQLAEARALLEALTEDATRSPR